MTPRRRSTPADEAIRCDSSFAPAYRLRGKARYQQKQYDQAIADFSAVIRRDPKDSADELVVSSAYFNRALAWNAKGDYDRAIADYDEAIRRDPKDPAAYNNRAWLWATCPDARFRDGALAIASATRACELSNWKKASRLGTLAAACAEAGDFRGGTLGVAGEGLKARRGREGQGVGTRALPGHACTRKQSEPYREASVPR